MLHTGRQFLHLIHIKEFALQVGCYLSDQAQWLIFTDPVSVFADLLIYLSSFVQRIVTNTVWFYGTQTLNPFTIIIQIVTKSTLVIIAPPIIHHSLSMVTNLLFPATSHPIHIRPSLLSPLIY